MIWIYLFYLVIWLNNIWMYSFTWIIPSIIITQIQHETSNTQYPAFRIEYPTSNIQYSTSHFMYIINKMMILEWKKQKNNHFPFGWSSWFFLWILLFLLLLFSCFFLYYYYFYSIYIKICYQIWCKTNSKKSCIESRS